MIEGRVIKYKAIFHPRFSILNPRSSILDPRSSILDPRSSILDPRSSILDPLSRQPRLYAYRLLIAEDLFERADARKQAAGFDRHEDDLRVVRARHLPKRFDVLHHDQVLRRISARNSVGDSADGFSFRRRGCQSCLRLAFGLKNGGLFLAFGARDGGLLLAFGAGYRGLLLAF